MKILVVGGGTAGLIAATILKKRFNFVVDMVRSSEIGTVGVGEGSTEHFRDYMHFLQIDPYELIYSCDATYKVGIFFKNWSDKDYLHNVFEDASTRAAQYFNVYAHQIANKKNNLYPKTLLDSTLNPWFLNRKELHPANQLHFDTNKLNKYLTSVAESLGVRIFDDEVLEVSISEKEEISHIVGKKREYSYDFYIDATGFKRVLIKNFDPGWVSFKKYLKMNSAFTFQTKNEKENIDLWTTSTAMSSGWMFSIPTWNHIGNGYIYDSSYIEEDEAVKEASKKIGKDVSVGKSFTFDPGHLDRTWIKNCVAIGLSGSFVEPLEATSIGTSIQQTFLLMHKLPNYQEGDIKKYNESFTSIMNNIRDFISLHYVTKRRDTEFWRDVSAVDLPESLKENLSIWKKRMPLAEDFCGNSSYSLFGPKNFIVVMEGLELFDRDAIKTEFESMNQEIINEAMTRTAILQELDSSIDQVKHIDFIRFIRSSCNKFSQGTMV
jgi:flavin-dependent dehydrogenase